MTRTKQPIDARTASFVQVVQPNYDWVELEADGEESRVLLPANSKSNEATIISPSGNTPAARAVRAHELLHARYTPDVVTIARKLTNHGVSAAAINFAEDVRLSKLAEAKGIYKTVDGHFDGEVVKNFLANIARQHGLSAESHERYPHFTTGKAVQAAIALIPHPLEVEGLDRNSVESILGHVEVVLGGDRTWNKVDLAKAQTLFDEAKAKIAEIENIAYRGPKAIDARFVDLANAIEDVLRRAYEETEKPKSEGGEGDKGEGEKGEGASGGGGGSSGEGEDNQDDNADQQDEKQDEQETQPEEKEEPKPKSGSRPKNSKPEFKPRGASPLADVLPRPPKIRKAAGSTSPLASGSKDIADAVNQATRSLRDEEAKSRRLQSGGEDAQKLVTNEVLLADYSLDTHWKGWGELEIKMAPLVRSKKALVPRRGKAGIDGSIPRHFSRWFVDRHILDVRGRRPGGTLLIDGSGSMSWSLEKTRQLIDVCPALTVAIYSSRSDSHKAGVLTILARNGRACDPTFDYETKHWHGGGNVVDGPALEWLCKQQGPRVWFSDGQVSGANENFHVEALLDAFRLAAAGQVTRTISYEQVVAILGGKAPQKPIRPDFVSAIQECRSSRRYPAHLFQGQLAEELDHERRLLAGYASRSY